MTTEARFASNSGARRAGVFDNATPLPVKASLVGALAYFLLPTDAIPDVLPVLGFTDDAAILAAAIKLMASHIRAEHRAAAKDKLAEFSKAYIGAQEYLAHDLPGSDCLEGSRPFCKRINCMHMR